jgi:hypothetical protein
MQQGQFKAARSGNSQQLRELLTVNNVDNMCERGWTSLHWATYNGRIECTQVCLEMGANVNARTTDLDVKLESMMPLHFASSIGVVEIVRALLDAGAEVDAKLRDGRTPLNFAIRFNHFDIARLLVDRGARVSNIKLDVSVIPDWLANYVESRSRCRHIAIIIIGHGKSLWAYDINVIRLIGKHIWSSRMDSDWSCTVASTRTCGMM